MPYGPDNHTMQEVQQSGFREIHTGFFDLHYLLST